jgi:hypothetical protein
MLPKDEKLEFANELPFLVLLFLKLNKQVHRTVMTLQLQQILLGLRRTGV